MVEREKMTPGAQKMRDFYGMKKGGYIPTCDHGVPEEVSFENYLHYRKRMLEYGR